MKSDVEIEKWSERRGDLETVQGASITFRVSRDELASIKIEAFDHRVRMSDIIRASLIYAGVIAKPTVPSADQPDAPGEAVAASGDAANVEADAAPVEAVDADAQLN